MFRELANFHKNIPNFTGNVELGGIMICEEEEGLLNECTNRWQIQYNMDTCEDTPISRTTRKSEYNLNIGRL